MSGDLAQPVADVLRGGPFRPEVHRGLHPLLEPVEVVAAEPGAGAGPGVPERGALDDEAARVALDRHDHVGVGSGLEEVVLVDVGQEPRRPGPQLLCVGRADGYRSVRVGVVVASEVGLHRADGVVVDSLQHRLDPDLAR